MTTPTDTRTLDRFLSQLREGTARLVNSSPRERLDLAGRCLEGVVRHAHEWVDAAADAKGFGRASPLRIEDVSTGPVSTARFLRLLIAQLEDLDTKGRMGLPGGAAAGPAGRVRVPLIPAKGLFDPVVFSGFKARVDLEPEISLEDFEANWEKTSRDESEFEERVVAVLGAGNVSSIPATDSLSKLFLDRSCVLLKMNPVNEYLGPIFENIFEPLIGAGYLRIVYGGAEVGGAATNHASVDAVHVTGSIATHDMIVWGPPGEDREKRIAEDNPVLRKEITSELGNVTPWIVIPGDYSTGQLNFQAENVAASITNNASHNCIATKVILTWKGWGARGRFLDGIDDVLKKTPPRRAYYPGSEDRYRKFAGSEPPEGDVLPWTVLRDAGENAPEHFFREESFVCVCVEVALEADSEEAFLEKAVEFANERLWGTLSANLTVPTGFRKAPGGEQRLAESIARLRYGTVSINQWAGLAFAMMNLPWGGAPGSPLSDAQGGIGWVHNLYNLSGVEKSVLEGPLTLFPKPIWFPTHKSPEKVGWALMDLYENSSVWNLVRLMGATL